MQIDFPKGVLGPGGSPSSDMTQSVLGHPVNTKKIEQIPITTTPISKTSKPLTIITTNKEA
jgi:hypothetical protein